MKRKLLSSLVVGLFLLVMNEAANATPTNIITNGDFETGDFSGWTLFTTDNGTLGGAEVVSFDTNNDGTDSNSARFMVGKINPEPDVYRGGGIYQNVNLDGGNYLCTVDIACNEDTSNNSGGLIELLFDDDVVDSYDFGKIVATTEYSSLSAQLNAVSAGIHKVSIRMSRPYTSGLSTPYQFLDNVSLTIPEPATLLLLGSGGLILLRKRRA